ncbi:hypothetical protein H4S14_003464 [Agrobacterium vitis]|nr:hypothetical protein [Agrobacterium vitis]MBE1439699.1 hypothetical protein [Agrobacterium vitis]
MKKLFGKIRLTRKMIWIFIGICVVCNATGAAAVFIGRDRLIGPSYADLNGLSCVEVQSVDIRRKDQVWVRKYVSVDNADGVNRIKTALRVAKAVADSRKVDLVQVVVLDKNGPKDRAGVRGRAIGADVVYIRDPKTLPAGVTRANLTARYVDGVANSTGDFYGTTVNIPTGNAAAIMAKMTDKVECDKPAGAAIDEKAKAKDEAPAHKDNASHGGEGDAAKATDHADAKPTAEHGGEAAAPAAEEKPGMIASIKSMIFGAEEKPASDANGEAKPASATAEGTKAEDKSGGDAASAKKPEASPVAVPIRAPAETVGELEPVEDKSLLSAAKSLVFGAKKPADDAKPVTIEDK